MGKSLNDLVNELLPLNRKEKFYTATVLPMIVCRDNFAHFDRLLSILPGTPTTSVTASASLTNIEFFTEYNLKESIKGRASSRFGRVPETRKTPDVAFALDDEPERTLVAIEGKMFHSLQDLWRDMDVQREDVISCLVEVLKIERVIHCALIPAARLSEIPQGFPYDVITWEQIRDAYKSILPDDYFLGMLELALDNYEELRSTKWGPGHAVVTWPLKKIRSQHKAGVLAYGLMGRKPDPSVLNGFEQFKVDLRRGEFSKSYGLMNGDPPSERWFDVRTAMEFQDEWERAS